MTGTTSFLKTYKGYFTGSLMLYLKKEVKKRVNKEDRLKTRKRNYSKNFYLFSIHHGLGDLLYHYTIMIIDPSLHYRVRLI